jgi:hypothetical protein
MGWINKNVILLFILFYLLCNSSFSIDFQATEFEKVDPEFRRSLEPPPAPGPSQASIAAKTTEKDYSEPTRMTIIKQVNFR